jgi:isopenicillin-N epimerase
MQLADWVLDPRVEHLNHGSFGGCPRAVLDAANAWRARLEAAPMQFFVLDWQERLDAARAALAAFVGAPAERMAFVPNATTGVATALGSLSGTLAAGDEIVVTDHGYRAVRNQVMRLVDERDVTLVTVPLPLPFETDAAVAAIERSITARTRIIVLDHITSPTALVLPVERIARSAALRGIAVVVDGAHAPGQLALDVSALLAAGVTYYAGNNHKWLCAPKASGFVVAAPGAAVRPVVTSHGASPEYGPPNRLHAALDWMGAYDPSAQLAVPVAIDEVARLGGGWPSVLARNHALALAMRAELAEALGGDVLGPDDALGTMGAIAIELPAGIAALAIEKQLLRDGWEVPIVAFVHGPLVRVSAHLYNDAAQIAPLAAKLRALGIRGRRL